MKKKSTGWNSTKRVGRMGKNPLRIKRQSQTFLSQLTLITFNETVSVHFEANIA